MSWAWAVPAGIAGAGVLVVLALARRVVDQAHALRRDLEGIAELRPALLEVRDETAATADAVRRLHRG